MCSHRPSSDVVVCPMGWKYSLTAADGHPRRKAIAARVYPGAQHASMLPDVFSIADSMQAVP